MAKLINLAPNGETPRIINLDNVNVVQEATDGEGGIVVHFSSSEPFSGRCVITNISMEEFVQRACMIGCSV